MRPSAATLSPRVASLLTVLQLESCGDRFSGTELELKHDDKVAMSCVRVSSIDCQSSAECIMAWSSA